ncbi:MAG: hypothetical protein NTU60_13280 [Candidatus Aminicenantes bacterium]|nr:hypothetical protein [Candidatus Aminicenantes bacterium]
MDLKKGLFGAIVFIGILIGFALCLSAQVNLLHIFKPTGAYAPGGTLITDGTYFYGMTARGGDFLWGTIFRVQPGESGILLLHSFAGGAADGRYPHGSLIVSDGRLYGMTYNGGASDRGTIFKINPDGSGFALLHTFAGGAGDGRYPHGSLICSGGVLYGMTEEGGASNRGTIFKINPDGSGFALLHTFAGGSEDGQYPYGSLISSDGVLYGMTHAGGASNNGTIFRVKTSGGGFELLRSFAGGAGDGQYPYGSLISSDGVLYGMTHAGGASDKGTIFKVNPDGGGFALLRSFAGGFGDGCNPRDSLICSGGVLYGMTQEGGASDRGTIFKINPDGSGFAKLHTFAGGSEDGQYPLGSLIVSDGTLYGMTYEGGASNNGTIFKVKTSGGGFALLRSFAGGAGEGKNPGGSLIVSGGVLYGMTSEGGASNRGTIFKINPDGSGFALLHTFAGGAGGGQYPYGSLISSDGVLYGMTYEGGASNNGTIFKVHTSGGEFVLLRSFAGGAGDGRNPYGSLIYSSGVLYGMTQNGGASDKGTIFKVNTSGGGFALLHAFAGGVGDGQYPNGSLIISGGVLYGMTQEGGASDKGTIFKVNTAGGEFALLRSFAGGAGDGRNPYGSLINSDGVLYGMTHNGGASDKGTIFKVNTSGGGFALLRTFPRGAGDGYFPADSLIISGGTLYGMTNKGGDSDLGTIFKINPDGSGFAWLHRFVGGSEDGQYPYGSLIISGGVLYGMTYEGGDADWGTVFSKELPTSTISGTVKVGQTALENVVMSGLTGTVKTNTSGQYTATVYYDWSGTVTPTLAGYAFDPANKAYASVTSNQTQNYAATLLTYTVSGTVKVGETALENVVMAGLPGTVKTNASGQYSGTVDYGWSGTVTPTLAGYTFDPADKAYASVTSSQIQNYAATLLTYTVSGTVKVGETALENVVMAGLPGTVKTNASGQYSGTVDYGWSGTVTPTLTGYTFDPASKSYTNVTSNQTSQNYAATLNRLPQIGLSRTNLNFGATSGGTGTSAQKVVASNAGGGILNWSAISSATWLSYSPGSGTGSGVIQVGVNPAGQAVGTQTGTVTISDPNATNSPQTINVTLTVKAAGTSTVPFGDFATPLDGTTGVTGAIPVTGWVVDDVEVVKVEILRDNVAGETPGQWAIGDAIFVEGARPDVEQAYPDYPLNYRTGWGYMMLTNFLPNKGNGTYKLYAYATDKEGNQVLLGTKTITCSNATAVKPFGTIDSPSQGGDASGNPYLNFGWVLTPLTKTVPQNGSTILVYVDGAYVGNLGTAPNVYDQYRVDVSTAFPGLNNTGAPGAGGPVGAYFLDTTKYPNGVHTIAWVATDDGGAADGIGSRYFNIINTGTNGQISAEARAMDLSSPLSFGTVTFESLAELYVSFDSLWLKRGFERDRPAEKVMPDDFGLSKIMIEEVGLLEISLDPNNPPPPPFRKGGEVSKYAGKVGEEMRHSGFREAGENVRYSGYQIVGDELRPLPIGSTLDPWNGRFSWMPGPGFLGDYDFVLVREDTAGSMMKTRLRIRILPKF